MDEGREHRVDTLEFDITFTVLQMRSKGTKAPLKRLLKSLSEPVQVVALLSEQMPAKNPKLGLTIRDTVKELQRLGGQNVRCEEQLIPWNRLPDPQTQRFGTSTEEPTVDPNQPGRSGPNFYFAAIILIAADRAYPVMGLEDLTTVQQILDRVGEGAYELVKPRARLAMVLPPEAAPGMEGMGAPQSPYLPLMNYIRGTFGYETLELKLAEQKRVPADVACVVVFEPNRLPARELYEIDRYLAQGGNVVFLFQGWQSKIDVGQTGGMTESLILNKVNVEPHFEEWAKTVGLEFGQDLLIHKRGKLAPYRIRNNRYQELVPGSVPLAGVVDAGDVNGESVYGRGLSGMTLPFMVELKLDDAKVGAAGLTRQDVITLQDEVYRFIPENPAFPQLPLRLNLNSPAEVEASPSATPEKGIRLQRLDHAPLVATSLRGQFKSFWAGEGRTVPAWEGTPKDDMLAGKAAPELKAKPGNLVVVSSAGTLSIDYLWGYPQEEIEPLIIQRGLVFYRNMVEAAMYGEDLAGLRARTGVAPRIKGPVEPGSRVMWYALCLLGAPAVLAALAMFRLAARSRRRQEHEAAFSGGQP
ncbi:MAG: Gldg family protein [Planctomycetes bacterium]|nr:Gldg family protein [Planctomycetota bacterium]